MARGKFIVLEGIDGCGKDTVAASITAHLPDLVDAAPWATSEPTEGPIGKFIRHLLSKSGAPPVALDALPMGLLFIADRLDHARLLEDALEAGCPVVCSRYIPSTLAYNAFGLGLEGMGRLLDLHGADPSRPVPPTPDLTLYLQVEASTATRRLQIRGRALDAMEQNFKSQAMAQRYDTVMSFLAECRGWKVVTVDANRDLPTVAAACWTEVEKLHPPVTPR